MLKNTYSVIILHFTIYDNTNSEQQKPNSKFLNKIENIKPLSIAYFFKKRTIQNIDFSILVWFFVFGADGRNRTGTVYSTAGF